MPRTLAGMMVVAAWLSCVSCRNTSRGSTEQDSSTDRPAARSVTWKDPLEVATGDAFVGPWRMNESEFHYVDNPTIAISADGTVAIAWVDNRQQNIFLQRYDATGRGMLDEPVDVSKSPGIFSWLPQVQMSDDAQEIFILWQEIVFSGGSHGGEIFFARSIDGGRSFAKPLNLSRSREGDGKGRLTQRIWHNGSLDLARGPNGTLYAAWTDYEGTLWFSRSTDRGERFTDPARVAGSHDAPARSPTLAVASGGTVHVAWASGEDQAADIRLAHSSNGGQSFGKPRVPFETGAHSDVPRIAVDSKGDLHLVFAESPAGMFGQYHLLYARLGSGQRVQRQPTRIAGPQAGVHSTHFPRVSVNGNDHVFVIWANYPERGLPPRGLGFVRSTNRGGTFSAPSLVPGTADPDLGANGGLQGFLMQAIAVNEKGSIAVANSRFKRNEASRVRLIRGQFEK